MNIRNGKQLLWLFCINFYISAFTFGGGYVVIPMIRKYFVEKKEYFSEEELLNMAAIAQSSPGAIAINLSALAGNRIAGFWGSIISCIAAVCPPLIILSVVSFGYDAFRTNPVIISVLKGMEAGVAALIVSLVLDMSKAVFQEKQILFSLYVPIAFIASFVFQVNAAIIIIISSTLSFVLGYRNKRKRDF